MDRWYRLLTIRQRHRFKSRPEVDGYKFSEKVAENFAYVSELAIDQLVREVASRIRHRRRTPPQVRTSRWSVVS
jgi:hypothetical protein